MTITPRATTATSSQAQFFDYASAANPLQQGLISTIPYRSFFGQFFLIKPERHCNLLI